MNNIRFPSTAIPLGNWGIVEHGRQAGYELKWPSSVLSLRWCLHTGHCSAELRYLSYR